MGGGAPARGDEAPRASAPPRAGTVAAVGLRNSLGENNCFLNVVVQTLLHLPSFRLAFQSTPEHTCTEPCVVCALTTLFANMRFSGEDVVSPVVVRQAMATLHRAEGRFQMGAVDDATEAMEGVLNAVHRAAVAGDAKDARCVPPCVAHACFGMGVMKQAHCACGVASAPIRFTQFVQYVPVELLRQLLVAEVALPDALSGCILSEQRTCERCGTVNGVQQHVLELPRVFVLALAWSSASAPLGEVEQVVAALAAHTHLHVPALFAPNDAPHAACGAARPTHSLRALVCYYGRHYVAYVEAEGGVVLLDDNRKRVVGGWLAAFAHIIQGRFQPCMVFFERARVTARVG